jgi:hypothetical protein
MTASWAQKLNETLLAGDPKADTATQSRSIWREQCCIAKNLLHHPRGLATLCTAAMRLCRAVCFLGRFLPKLGGAKSAAIFLPVQGRGPRRSGEESKVRALP